MDKLMIEYISEKLIKEIINKRIKGKNDEWMNEMNKALLKNKSIMNEWMREWMNEWMMNVLRNKIWMKERIN